MKVLLIGANGQLGWELNRSLMPLGDVVALGHQQCDLSRIDEIPGIVREIGPDIIVNAAAFTAVDDAESKENLVNTINGDAVGVLAKEAKKYDALLVHYSTDYVFDGSKSIPYLEDDDPNPLNVYGRSKLVGEDAVRQSGCRHLIFRVSWVYASRGFNFARKMLQLAGERDQLRVVADQYGAPTSAELIADITALCLYRLGQDNKDLYQILGTYHLAPTGETSWYDYAKYVISEAKNYGAKLRTESDDIYPISTSEFPLPAKRPASSRLDCEKLCRTFGINLPDWKLHVRRMVAEIVRKD